MFSQKGNGLHVHVTHRKLAIIANKLEILHIHVQQQATGVQVVQHTCFDSFSNQVDIDP